MAETSDAFAAGLGRPSRGRYGSDLMVEVLRELGIRYYSIGRVVHEQPGVVRVGEYA